MTRPSASASPGGSAGRPPRGARDRAAPSAASTSSRSARAVAGSSWAGESSGLSSTSIGRRRRRRTRSRQALTVRRWSQASNRSGSRRPGQVTPGPDEGLLDRVVRELRVPEDQAGCRVQPRERRVDEAREGVMIAPLCSPDEVSLVHVRLGERPPPWWLDSVWRLSSGNRSQGAAARRLDSRPWSRTPTQRRSSRRSGSCRDHSSSTSGAGRVRPAATTRARARDRLPRPDRDRDGHPRAADLVGERRLDPSARRAVHRDVGGVRDGPRRRRHGRPLERRSARSSILVLIQLGGFGFMTGSTLLLLLVVGRRTALSDRILAQESAGARDLGSVRTVLRRVAVFTLIAEGIGALALTVRVRDPLRRRRQGRVVRRVPLDLGVQQRRASTCSAASTAWATSRATRWCSCRSRC